METLGLIDTMTFLELRDVLWKADQTARGYIESSPQWVQYWILWMTAVLAPSFVIALFKREARWIALAVFYSTVAAPWVIALAGPSKLWGITHLMFWPMALAVIIPKLAREPVQGWYNRYLAVVAVTMLVSLVFDAWDVYQFVVAR